MSKQPKGYTTYSKTEQKAEAEIDRFLHSISSPTTHTVLDELRNLV